MDDKFVLGANRYGKADVRFLRVLNDKIRHEVYEFRAVMLMEGKFEKSYHTGDNSQVVPTDTQKNTLYALSKKYPVEPVEEWAIAVAKDMMSRHAHVSAVNLDIEIHPWQRLVVNGQEHNHAFRRGPPEIRTCTLRMTREGELRLESGFRDLQVLKTTQSGFEGYVRDEYTTLAETTDRIFCTKIKCNWTYLESAKNWKALGKNHKVGYTEIYKQITRLALEIFAGDPARGTYSGSVQQTLFHIGKAALSRFDELEKISFVLPNIHFFLVDFKGFKTTMTNNNEVFHTHEGAHGYIEGTIERKDLVKSKL